MPIIYSKIAGTGSYLPSRRISNDELANQLADQGIETSHEWIWSRSGIVARHYAAADMMASDMAVAAAEDALDMAGLQAQDIDLILLATSTPDHLGSFPSTACIVQRKLGITNHAPAMDLQAVCSGFIYALTVTDSLIRIGAHKNVLVIGTEVFSRILDFTDRTTCVLFGDGAGAVIMTASEQPGMLAAKLHADGRYSHLLCMPNSKHHHGAVDAYMYMDGPAVFKLAVSVLDAVARETLQAAGINVSSVDWFIPHQANLRIMQGTARKLGLPLEKMVVTVSEHANTSAASIPLALDLAVRDGRVRNGQYVLMEGVGGGLTWGAALVRM